MGEQNPRWDCPQVTSCVIIAARKTKSSTMLLSIGIIPSTGTAWLPTKTSHLDNCWMLSTADGALLTSSWRISPLRLSPTSAQAGHGWRSKDRILRSSTHPMLGILSLVGINPSSPLTSGSMLTMWTIGMPEQSMWILSPSWSTGNLCREISNQKKLSSNYENDSKTN